MVSQLLKVSSVKPSFDYIKDVYKVCLEKYLNNPSITFDSIKRGRKILQSEEEVDAYIAFYGAHHYYKLIEAFDALDTSRFKNSQLEIFSYGSGAATAACSLISYCRSRQINLPFQEFALIEPSNVALTRGVKYINQALSHQESEAINVK